MLLEDVKLAPCGGIRTMPQVPKTLRPDPGGAIHACTEYLPTAPDFSPQGILTQFGACCTWHARCGAPCFINLAPDLPVCALACLIRLSPVHALFFNSSPGNSCWLVSLSDLTAPCWTTRPGRKPKPSAARQPSSLPIVKEPTPNGRVLFDCLRFFHNACL